MSFDGIRKRRCVVQKLDFENCIVTNIKTTARGRKKLRARITREFEHFTNFPCEESSDFSPQSTRPSSPVLIRKQCRNVDSPILAKRKNSPEENTTEGSITEDVPSSPVFRTFKKHKTLRASPNLLVKDSQKSSSSGLPSSFQIEEFTQESKQSVKISSVESPIAKTENCCSGEGVECGGPIPNCLESSGQCESPKPLRRNYKKNSLLSRLHKLQQKQASEKLLWQHQNRKNSANSLTLLIVTFWKDEFNYYLKCQSVDSETTFLIIDSRWVPSVRNVKEGSVLQLHPPWQKLSGEGATILLSVICLDLLDETKEPFVPKITSELVSVDRFVADQKLFIDSLFSSCGCGFLF